MGFLTDIGAAIIEGLRTLIGYLAASIFDFIVILYDLFIYLSRIEILNSDFIQNIYNKVGSILILFMIFKLTFSLINALISTDKFNDKKNGFVAIITRSIFSIVLLGITPFIFKELFAFQRLIIGTDNSNDNILYKLVLSDAIVSDSTSFGKTLASKLFFSFYTDNQDPKLGTGVIETPNGQWVTEDLDYIKNYIETNDNASFFFAVKYLTLKNKTGEYYIEYDVVFPIVIGIFVAWILIMYCIQVAVRVFQLAYLQLIAPIPILSYISDPDGTFKKWINQCMSTYLDLFIRLLIIYFILYFCDYITKNIDNIINFDLGIHDSSNAFYIWIYIFLIIGLLVFAKKVPDLIKDLFPKLGGAGKFSFGLNPKKEIFDPIKASPITKVAATVTKPIGTLARKTIGGIDSARAGYGFSEGWKKNRGAFGTWVNKQQEKYTPYSYEQKKNSASGAKEVKEIDNKWNSGVDMAKKLMKERGLTAAGTGATGWDKALDGVTTGNYEAIFRHNEFITSKRNLDKAKQDLDALRDGLLQVQSGGSFVYGGVTYTSANAADLSKKYNSQSGAVSGLESVHNSMRKQYADDARAEDTFKFIKNNASNPASPSNTHGTEGI